MSISRYFSVSHENANFLFSVFRVVQGEAKTRGKTNPPKPGSIRIRRGSVRIFEDPWIRGSKKKKKKKLPAQLAGMHDVPRPRPFFFFTCSKDWHFSFKMNIRMSVQNLTFLSPGSLFVWSFLCTSSLPLFQRKLTSRWHKLIAC